MVAKLYVIRMQLACYHDDRHVLWFWSLLFFFIAHFHCAVHILFKCISVAACVAPGFMRFKHLVVAFALWHHHVM